MNEIVFASCAYEESTQTYFIPSVVGVIINLNEKGTASDRGLFNRSKEWIPVIKQWAVEQNLPVIEIPIESSRREGTSRRDPKALLPLISEYLASRLGAEWQSNHLLQEGDYDKALQGDDKALERLYTAYSIYQPEMCQSKVMDNPLYSPERMSTKFGFKL